MIIIIDESGEVSANSIRRYFVLGLIKIEENESAEGISTKILDISKKINHKTGFKFSKTKKQNRIDFLNSLKDCKFKFRCLVVDKTRLQSDFLKNNPTKAYNFFLKQLLEKSIIAPNSLIQIDGNAPKEMRREISSYLKNFNIKYKKLEFADSKKNRLIQLADMFVSSVGSRYNNNNAIYYNLIKSKIENEWVFK